MAQRYPFSGNSYFWRTALTSLTGLYLSGNPLKSLTLGAGLKSLTYLNLSNLGLTNLTLADDLTSLTEIDLGYNSLTNFMLPLGLTNLTDLEFSGNHLTRLTLPAGLVNLTTLGLSGNPLKTFILPESLAVSNLAATVAYLRSQGVSVHTYPPSLSLVSPRQPPASAFEFTLTGPPAVYTIRSSIDLATWNELGALTNTLGTAVFTDAEATNLPQKFYRAMTKLP